MPVVASPDELFATVRKSRVVADARLDAFLAKAGDPAARPPLDWGKELVRQGLLTQFQAQQILHGRWKGFTLGKYKILELVGTGGMGKVYLCEHTLLNSVVAVKTLQSAAQAEPGVAERFVREARAALTLSHPHIVRAFDLDRDGDLYFLAMEFVDGSNLHELVARRGFLPADQAAHALAQAALGLQHAHEGGWVHRDIKPGNLLVDRSGVVKILDFGLARVRAGGHDDHLTKQIDGKAVLGTADFLAPEQAINSSDVDIRADIYSLGATGYFLLTGKPPFEGGSTAQKLLSHQLKSAPRLADSRPDVPPELAEVIEAMMAKRPADRYQTPAEVAAALAPFATAPPAPPTGAELRAWCPAVRDLLRAPTGRPASTPDMNTPPNITAMLSTVNGAVTARLGPPGSSPRGSSPGGPRSAGRPPARSRGRLIAAAGGLAALLAAGGGAAVWLSSSDAPRPAPPTAAAGPAVTPPTADTPPAAVAAPDTPIPPAEVGKYVGQKVTVEFEVKNTGRNTTNTLAFLNSELNYRDDKCFTVVIDRDAEARFKAAGIDDVTDAFQGKVIRATGTITTYNMRPQMKAAEPDQIVVLDASKPVPADQLPRYVNQPCKFEFTVASAGQTGPGLYALNSRPDAASAGNFAAVMGRNTFAKLRAALDVADIQAMVGRTVRVTGKLTAADGGFRIEVSDPGQVEQVGR